MITIYGERVDVGIVRKILFFFFWFFFVFLFRFFTVKTNKWSVKNANLHEKQKKNRAEVSRQIRKKDAPPEIKSIKHYTDMPKLITKCDCHLRIESQKKETRDMHTSRWTRKRIQRSYFIIPDEKIWFYVLVHCNNLYSRVSSKRHNKI